MLEMKQRMRKKMRNTDEIWRAYMEQQEEDDGAEMMMKKENEETGAVKAGECHHLAVLVVDSERHARRR